MRIIDENRRIKNSRRKEGPYLKDILFTLHSGRVFFFFNGLHAQARA